VGGLNFQIEHHLFPTLSHVNYPAIAGVVEQTCREYGVPYNVNRSFGGAVASHFRWLKRMGRPPELAASR
jgi:linoleoyl-CoA desaturase